MIRNFTPRHNESVESWSRHPWPVINYITEEVDRQGHDTSTLDGMVRVRWMLDAWIYAIGVGANKDYKPGVGDALTCGALIEPLKNGPGVRNDGIRIGSNVIRTSPQEITTQLDKLWEVRDTIPPLEFYKQFEIIHPFVDGNGRTGKVLLNWLNGTLFAPVFPPNDLFGDPIVNP